MPARRLAVALAALAACSAGIDGIPISALRPDFTVETPFLGPTRVTAVLWQGDARFQLYEWDRLSTSAGGEARVLLPVEGPGGLAYAGDFPPLLEGDLASVSYATLGAPGAVPSTVRSPAPVAMTSPSAGTAVAVGGKLPVAWLPSGTGDGVRVRIRVTRCSGGGTGGEAVEAVPDTGAADVTVPPGILPPVIPPGGSCTAAVLVERFRPGEVNGQFAPGGRIESRQVSNVVAVAVEP
jgi:hypothetical protein